MARLWNQCFRRSSLVPGTRRNQIKRNRTRPRVVVVERVERADQLAMVAEMQCDLVQGFYYSPAVPAEKFERFLTEQPPWLDRQDAA